jgi:hypothetical protein
MNIPMISVVLAGVALLVCAGLAVFGSMTGDATLTSGAFDLLKVVVGGIAGALGASVKS